MEITFALVPTSVILDKTLTGEELRLYCLILQRSHTQGFCWSSTATLAAEVQTAPRRVGKVLKSLEEKNYINRSNVSKETEGGRKIAGRRIYPQVFISKEEAGLKGSGLKKAYPKGQKDVKPPSPKWTGKEISLSSKEERQENNSSSDVVPFTGTTPKAVAPEPQERNTVSSQPAGFTTAASGLDKKILALTDNLHTNASWTEYMKGKYGSGYRESDEYEKMAKALRS